MQFLYCHLGLRTVPILKLRENQSKTHLEFSFLLKLVVKD